MWNKSFPDSAFIPAGIQFILMFFPVIEIAGNRNRSGIRRPYAKIHTPYIIYLYGMRAEFFIQTIMSSVLIVRYIIIGEQRIIQHRFGSIHKMGVFVFFYSRL